MMKPWFSRYHNNFIQQNLSSGLVQVQILLVADRRFAMMRISDNGPAVNKVKRLSPVKHSIKKKLIHDHVN